jgi:hypothetical protein
MKETLHCIYQHSNPSTGEVFYIGLGLKDRPYNFTTGRSKEWKEYVIQNGKPNVKILHNNLTADEADRIERELVSRLGRKGVDIDGILLNKSSGGQKGALGFKHEPDSLEKRSQSMTGKKMHSDQQKQKWSLERTGRKNNWDPNKVKADKNRSKPSGFTGKGYTPVLQYDLQGNLIKKWPNQKEVFNSLGIRSSAIWSNIKGLTKQAGGYVWKLDK